MKTRMPLLMLLGVLMSGAAAPDAPSAAEPPTLKFTGGCTDLQALLDKAMAGAVVVCEQTEPLVVAKTIRIARPITLRGLKACLPEKLGDTDLPVVETTARAKRRREALRRLGKLEIF